MIIDISKITLENIHLYSLIGNVRKGQHLTKDEKEFLEKFKKPKEITIYKKCVPRIKFKTEEERKRHIKEYQHNYYLRVTKIRRKKKYDNPELLKEEIC